MMNPPPFLPVLMVGAAAALFLSPADGQTRRALVGQVPQAVSLECRPGAARNGPGERIVLVNHGSAAPAGTVVTISYFEPTNEPLPDLTQPPVMRRAIPTGPQRKVASWQLKRPLGPGAIETTSIRSAMCIAAVYQVPAGN